MLKLPDCESGVQLYRRRTEAQGGKAEGLDIYTITSERKIDQIEQRLCSIEKLLRDLSNNSNFRRGADLPLHEAPPSTASSSNPMDTSGAGDDHRRAAAGDSPLTATAHDSNDDIDDIDDAASSTPTNELDSSAFEGNSSLTAHTVFASEFLEHAVERTSLRDLNPSMAAALTSLKQIVGLSQKQQGSGAARRGSTGASGGSGGGSSGGGGGGGGSSNEVRFAHQRPLPRGGFRELPMPPVQAVIPVLREVKETPPGTFTLISVCCFMAVENFAEACRRVYFALEDFSHANFIIVNMGLYYLFQEKAVVAGGSGDTAARDRYTGYYELCRDNLETGLANLRFFLGASMETIEALLLGASYAIEVSRPSLAWQLNTTAAQLCQDLGYHRVTGGTVNVNSANGSGGGGSSSAGAGAQDGSVLSDKKAILFWFSYMLDRGLALRLGRAPTIQDFDVTLPRVIGRVNAPDMWKEVLRLWIAHADIQGQIYERLYSPSSLGHPVGQRVETARRLASRLKMIAEQALLLRSTEMGKLKAGGGGSAEGGSWADARKATVMEMVMKSDQVSFLSSLTLVYRAIPAGVGGHGFSTFTPECIETARLAMQTHEECMKLMGSNLWVAASYIHWTILYAPFVPFIVIFCHIIETSNMADLQRLRDFIASLQPTCAVSEGVDKLHRLFSVLQNVATLYVEAKTKANSSEPQDTDMAPIGNEFDVYLSALGFMPVDGDLSAAQAQAQVHQAQVHQAHAAAAAAAAAASGALPTSPVTAGSVFGASPVTNAAAMNQTSQLGDWFSGNRYMMGLLEEDLSQFQPNSWTNA
ncbi:hypothetical protein N8I77_010786 [Diaporthe amygdali]|uniref:Xylanolytic transcriptional activator regulatory domain-containing protein n=1 Tax=Phomopsis amygdali TaxID=1214568 RepID=A0AAD9VZH9_PHOAM|nr:hypothetical protein N8I77_010786 [Diaporthe amygdali]